MKKKILLAEDDPNFGLMLKSFLSVNSYEVTLCDNGNKAYNAFKSDDYDLCIFDVMMPDKDGFALASDIAKINKKTPFFFLTAKALKEDIVKGYKLGAIDYLVKPFDPEILLLKIQAVLASRSKKEIKQSDYSIGSFSFDSNKRQLTIDDNSIRLSPKESELLKLLCDKNGEILTREEALLKIWKEDSYFTTKSMDVYITKLRKYLKADSNYNIVINNVHSKGFLLQIENK